MTNSIISISSTQIVGFKLHFALTEDRASSEMAGYRSEGGNEFRTYSHTRDKDATKDY